MTLRKSTEKADGKVAKLPWAVTGLRGITLDNAVFMAGGYDIDGNGRDEVLRYYPDTDIWTESGKMSSSRYYHALAEVSWEDYQEYCQTTESSQAENLPHKIEDSLKHVKIQNISENFKIWSKFVKNFKKCQNCPKLSKYNLVVRSCVKKVKSHPQKKKNT